MNWLPAIDFVLPKSNVEPNALVFIVLQISQAVNVLVKRHQ